MKNLSRLFKLMFPYLGHFILAVVCLGIVTLCIVAFTSLVGPILDNVWTNTNFNAEPGSGIELQLKEPEKEDALSLSKKIFNLENTLPASWLQPQILIPILLVIIFFIKGLSSYIGNYQMAAIGQRVVKDIRNNLYSSIIDKPISFFRSRSTGSLISRITNDVERIQYAVSTNLADLIRETLTVLALAAYIFYRNATFAIVALIVAPLILAPIIQFGKRLRSTSRRGQEQMEGLTNRLHETFSGIRIVKAFSAEDHEKKRFQEENDRMLRVILKGNKYFSLTAPVMEMIGAFGVAYMIYWGFTQISLGNTTVGDFSVILVALYGMYNPIKKLSRINNFLQQAFAAVDRVFDVLAIRNEIHEHPDAVNFPGFEKGIRFNNVSFSYGDRRILTDIDFSVPKGKVCAIVGLSGAGKTTLVNLLPRFDDASMGTISIDGRDIRDFTLSSLRGNIGIVTQETILFNDSVKSNISYGNSFKLDDPQITEAAKAAYAHDFIMKMPNGYDTIIGEKGIKISGGERQRLAIARALIKNPPILILDEATSALDSESERLVQSALENLMSHRTTFVIAHRLSTVRKADIIIVLQDGRLIEQGTHSELIRQDGTYSKLYSLQFADVLPEELNENIIRT